MWAIRSKYGREWRAELVPGWKNTYRMKGGDSKRPPSVIAVSAVDRLGNESVTVVINPLDNMRVRIIE